MQSKCYECGERVIPLYREGRKDWICKNRHIHRKETLQ